MSQRRPRADRAPIAKSVWTTDGWHICRRCKCYGRLRVHDRVCTYCVGLRYDLTPIPKIPA